MSDTKTVSGNIVHIQDKGAPTALSVIANITPKQSGTGTPSPSNVRPISGWESVDVNVAGKNLLTTMETSGTASGVTYTAQSDGSIKAVGTSTGTYPKYIWTDGKRLPAGNYILSAGGEVSSNGVRLSCSIKRAGGNTQYYECTSNADKAFTVYADDQSMSVYMRTNGGSTAINATVYPMIRLASDTDATFEPYTGTTTTTTLGQTVYGGTLDVVTGVLTVTHAIVDLTTKTWTYSSNYSASDRAVYYSNAEADAKPSATSRTENSMTAEKYFVSKSSDTLTTVGIIGIDTSKRFWVSTTAQSVTPSGNVAYELATPQTYTLTGQNVTLLKDCYAWADSGDISITYETYLINGLFHKILINGVKMFAPNDFTLERSDVYAGEITTCTGKLIADRIGWKYADMGLTWDYLPQEYLETILNLSGVFTITFENEEGFQFTEQCIRKGSTMTGTRFTDNDGNMMWKGVQFDISFINVHN